MQFGLSSVGSEISQAVWEATRGSHRRPPSHGPRAQLPLPSRPGTSTRPLPPAALPSASAAGPARCALEQVLGLGRQPGHVGGGQGGQVRRRRHLADGAGAGQPGTVLEAAAQLQRGRRGRRLEQRVGRPDGADGGQRGSGQRRRGVARGESAAQDGMHRVHCVGGVRWVAGRVAHGPAVEGRVVAPVNLTNQPLHLLQGAGEHEDVVSGQQESGDLGEFAHRRPVRVRHDLAQPVHGEVQVVHPLALASVDLQSQLLEVLLRQLLLDFVLAALARGLGAGPREAFPGHLLHHVALRGRDGVEAALLVVVMAVVVPQIQLVHVRR